MPAGAFDRDALVAFLNAMLEAERAGARALLEYLGEHERRGEAWTVLRRVQGDEAHNCALIGRQLARLGAPYSHATGAFYDKAVAVQGRKARIEMLVRGLRWAVRAFEDALPRLDAESRAMFAAMRETHLRSIGACEAVIATLAD